MTQKRISTPFHSGDNGYADSPYQDQARLHALQVMLSLKLKELLVSLGVSLYSTRKMLIGACPIHGGDNVNALNLYPEGDSRPGYWKCNTRHCEYKFKKTVIGFVRGVLSAKRHGWTPKSGGEGKISSWKETVDYCCAFLGVSLMDIKVDYEEMEKARFISNVSTFTRRASESGEVMLSRDVVRGFLDIPSAYFVNRGWDAAVLDRYDVGLYPAEGRPLSNRVAVPIYDEGGRFAIGFTSRSIFESCGECKRYHSSSSPCPTKEDFVNYGRSSKWFNHGFAKQSSLYGLWFAKKPIRDSGKVLLVESPGSVWKVVASGCESAVALYGVEMSDEQQVMLEMSGATEVYIGFDGDEAGRSAASELANRLKKIFKVRVVAVGDDEDIGQMSDSDCRRWLEDNGI